jgi:hypothetical protein
MQLTNCDSINAEEDIERSVAAPQVLHLEQVGRILLGIDLALELAGGAMLGLQIDHRKRVVDADAGALVDR